MFIPINRLHNTGIYLNFANGLNWMLQRQLHKFFFEKIRRLPTNKSWR